MKKDNPLKKKDSDEKIIEKVKYVLHARKSTEQDEKQALSIGAQIKEMKQIAERDDLDIIEIKEESHSAKAAGQRPVFNEIILGIQSGKFTGILTWAPDRISRNAGDLGIVVDLFDQEKLIEVRTFSQRFRNNPNEKFLLMILGSQAKLENDQKSLNVKRGLRTRCEMGFYPCIAPTGYLNDTDQNKPGNILLDPKRAIVIKEMFEKVGNESWSGRETTLWLKDKKKFTTKRGKPLMVGNVYRLLRNTFYFGMFEYPKGSDNWYQGVHQPIITKELFDKVQETLAGRYVPKTESKEFAFTKLMVCGNCGSGITADEKFKKLKGDGVNRHVYYRCTKSKDLNCKNQPISETKLLDELLKLVDVIKLDKLSLIDNIKEELNRYNKFRVGVLNSKQEKVDVSETDIKNYMRYLLKNGSILEKREMLSGINEQIILSKKKLFLQDKLDI